MVEKQKRHVRVLVRFLGALLLGMGLCYALYEFSPIGWVLYFLTVPSFEGRAEALIPEFNQLNDELWESLPEYPHATLLPESQRRWGIGHHTGPPGGPTRPPLLHFCFGTNDSIEQVAGFYQDVLQDDSWKMSQERLDTTGQILNRKYAKDRACVDLHRFCLSENRSDAETVYGITVYHDLNMLIGFPGIPKILYWLDEIEHCP